MNIVLTGFMASGKTSTARCIAEMSDYEFIDTDDMIVAAEGRAVNEIFANDGEEYFRRVEHETVCAAAAMDKKVISTGGGVVLNRDNIKALRLNGVVFNIAPDFSVIEGRIALAAKTRPLMQNRSIEEIKRQFDERRPFYANCDYCVHVADNETPEQTAQKILNIMKDKKM